LPDYEASAWFGIGAPKAEVQETTAEAMATSLLSNKLVVRGFCSLHSVKTSAR
jgi:hypothetical protein